MSTARSLGLRAIESRFYGFGFRVEGYLKPYLNLMAMVRRDE